MGEGDSRGQFSGHIDGRVQLFHVIERGNGILVSSAGIEIIQLRDRPELLGRVISLGDKFRGKLGLFPRNAWVGSMDEGEILVALRDGDLLGYLLFRVSRRHPPRATIIHLCVDAEYRGRGCARQLVDELKDQTRELDGLRLSCRRDYPENKLWPRLGFQLLAEKPGRSKAGTPLNIWWFAHGSPLLSRMSQAASEHKLVAAMDANVVFDCDSDESSSRESQSLLADWLSEHIQLMVTPELNAEIDREEQLAERERSRRQAQRFPMMEVSGEKFELYRDALRAKIGPPSSESARSDLRQMAWAAAGGADFFVTRDGRLLELAEGIEEVVELKLIRPSELITRIDELVNEAAYQPRRFEGSRLQLRPVDPGDEDRLVRAFLDFSGGERKPPFIDRVRQCIAADPGSVMEVVDPRGQPCVLYALRKLEDGTAYELTLLRCAQHTLAATVLRQRMSSMIHELGHGRIVVREPRVGGVVAEALTELRFVETKTGWVRACLRYLGPAGGAADAVRATWSGREQSELAGSLKAILDEGRAPAVIEVERSLAPAKFTDLELPCYVVPIRPHWASQLFDSRLAEQELFGLPPELGFRLENAYYRSRLGALDAPARLLWYVSMGKGTYHGAGSIRAASYLDEVVVDTPKRLFARFRRLGVYRWEDVLSITKGEVGDALMALLFSGTELLRKPVPWADLQAILQEELGRSNQLQRPLQITTELFFRIYERASPRQGSPSR